MSIGIHLHFKLQPNYITIETLTVGQLQTNCYIIAEQSSKTAIIVDPGDDADYIERIVADKHLTPLTIIATHGHFDHILAVTELTLAYNIPFLIHEKDTFLVRNMQRSARHFLGITVDPAPRIDRRITANDVLKIHETNIKIIETPGHTPGSICLFIQDKKLLFCGDLLFSGGGVGRTDFSYSNSNDLSDSLKKILTLPKETKVYPGHGNPTTISNERALNYVH